ncbi:MAG: hypothetical protein J5663_10220 [Bacteroidaceae bacterium]|nr:hypothetical protein [Bacteroidaceae bacterium]
MNKVWTWSLHVPYILFFVWYLVASFVNVYACDDYWHGTNVHLYGFENAQLYYWYNWEGSFTHTFLATLPHIFSFERMPFICNLISLLFLLLSVMTFLRTFYCLTRIKAFICSCYLVAFLYTFTTGKAEIRFWVCANVTYLFGVSTTLIFLSLYHVYDYSIKKTTILILLMVVIVGNKISFVYMLFLVTICHDIVYGRLTKKRFFFMSLSILFLSMFNILAPGNVIRMIQNLGDSEECRMTFEEAITDRFFRLLPFVKHLFLLTPICKFLNVTISKSTIVILTLAFVFIFVGDTTIMYLCFHDSGPMRTNITLEVSAVLYSMSLICYFNAYLKSPKLKIISWLLIMVFAAYGCRNMFLIKQSYEYSRLAKERERKVLSSNDEKELFLSPLPNSGLLLSYFCNDKEWLENVYIPYYNNKTSEVFVSCE